MESSGLTSKTQGITHLPSSVWLQEGDQDPQGPGAQAAVLGAESSGLPHRGHLRSPGCVWPASAPAGRQGPGLWEGRLCRVQPRVTLPPLGAPSAGSFAPSFAPHPLLPHTLSVSLQNLSPRVGHPFTSSSSFPASGLCMVFAVEHSPTHTPSFSSTRSLH